MSAPDTNLERQKSNHRAPLTGIALAVGLAAFGFVVWLALVASDGNSPGERPVVDQREVAPAVVIEERAGEGSAAAVTD